VDKDKSLNFNELKFMMEKLGIPQTHLGLKEMIKQVDEDQDGKVSFREVKKNKLKIILNLFLVF
jgi:Ca2+-binding EF-hand superfamily protein